MTTTTGRPEFFLFLPQMRMTVPELVERARRAEAAGFEGIALMDHLAPPLAERQPMYEAVTTATWLAANTTRVRISHLVLCDALRAPAVLARQAVTIDHASGGRFELGLGSGSVPSELARFGIENPGSRARTRRLAETLEVLRLLWSGAAVDYDGEFHHLSRAQQQPPPRDRIPLLVGGAGDAILELASRHADWWNLPLSHVDRFAALAPRAEPARASLQRMVAYVTDETSRDATTELATRRFGTMPGGGPLIGDASELRDSFLELHARGIERFYVWFTDFADAGTLHGFGEHVIAATVAP